ncbi:MAG: PIN domain-containing protein [Waterburya sp.]
MLLIDTSVWIEVFSDKSKSKAAKLKTLIANRNYYLPIFTKMELLQGCKNEAEWNKLSLYLENQNYFDEVKADSVVARRSILNPDYNSIWENAARLYFELRCQGITIRSNIDCAIAQRTRRVIAIIAIENNFILYHVDRDFEMIAKYTVLKQQRIDWQ